MLSRTWPALCDELVGHYRSVLETARPQPARTAA
jgi:hypothetical protein